MEDFIKAKLGADVVSNPAQDKGNDLNSFLREHFIVCGIRPLNEKQGNGEKQ